MKDEKEYCALQDSPALALVPNFEDLKGEDVLELSSQKQLKEAQERYVDKVVGVVVWVKWHPPCNAVREAIADCAPVEPNFRFFWMNAEGGPEQVQLVERFGVKSVPALVLVKPCGRGHEVFEGPSPKSVHKILLQANQDYASFFEKEKFKVYDEIEGILRSHSLVVCLRGTKDDPQCPESRRIIDYLNKLDLLFRTFNVLGDWRIHQWLKFYAQSPSFPQLYVKGCFIGTGAHVCEKIDSDEFVQHLPSECLRLGPLEKIKLALKLARVVLFLKGSLFNPRDEYSALAIKMLEDANVRFTTFDVLPDSKLREYLKEFTGVSSFPQLFLDGSFYASFEQLRELAEAGRLKEQLPLSEMRMSLGEKVEKLVRLAPVMLFIRGTPEFPECPESARILELLADYSFKHFDVLSDPQIRAELQRFSKWQSFPQLYVEGKLVGGVEIVGELAESGELHSLLPSETD